jgi:hypothetical protein
VHGEITTKFPVEQHIRVFVFFDKTPSAPGLDEENVTFSTFLSGLLNPQNFFNNLMVVQSLKKRHAFFWFQNKPNRNFKNQQYHPLPKCSPIVLIKT